MQLSMPTQLNTAKQKVSSLFQFVTSGQVIVSFVRWLVTTGGTIAESAFLLATLWVTVNNVAHLIVSWVLPENVIQILNQVSVIAFSVLPELIIFAAIKITFDHWQLYYRSREKMALAWAIAYTPFTITFAVMTVLVLSSFVSVQATSNVSPQATGAMLVIRCLAGWGYGVVQMLFASLGKQGYAGTFEKLNSIIRSRNSTLAERDSTIAGLQESVTLLEEKANAQEREIVTLRLSLANKRLSRSKNDSGAANDTLLIDSPRVSSRKNDSSTFEATDNGETLTVTGEEMTLVATGEKRSKLKSAMQQAILNGEKINLKHISEQAGVSYGMARNHAKTIIEEITQETGELQAISAPAARVAQESEA